MKSPHAKAVLFVYDHLNAADHTVISANTDEQADPQIFAQSSTGEFAFYFIRVNTIAPSPAERERFLALAAKHDVAAHFASVTLDGPAPAVTVSPL